MPDEITGTSQNTLSDEDKAKQADTEFNNRLNSAVTAHTKRLTEKVLPGLISEAMKPLLEQITALKAAPVPAPDDKDNKKIDPEFTALQRQFEEVKQQAADDRKARAAAEEKARSDRAFSDFKGALAKGGVRPEMLDMVANHLFHIEKKVEVDESGVAIFKGIRSTYGVDEEVAYPLESGVDNWVKSDAAKPFLPSPGTSQTPTTQRKTITPSALPKDFNLENATPLQRIQAADEMANQMAAALATRGIKAS